ncbi:hypothetical protein PUN28_009979 [Cardiocondyla obscurior]|uniref:Uncharacterized protein n=1 Tax=Cardiocondyla obscurior TaxID=286306 RepID=A0AAW2FND8_9HYME
MEKVPDKNRLQRKALLLISPENTPGVKRKNIKEPSATRDKGVRTAERNFNVSWSERKKTITTDSDDRSSTSECDADEQKDESEEKRREYARIECAGVICLG